MVTTWDAPPSGPKRTTNVTEVCCQETTVLGVLVVNNENRNIFLEGRSEFLTDC